MSDNETETEYKQRFMGRIKAARVARSMKQWEIAEALGMAQDKYKQYETRSLLPHHLIGRFCIICRIDAEWLVTGRGQKPMKPVDLTAAEPAPAAAKSKRTRAIRVA
jgi:hypothetical protein